MKTKIEDTYTHPLKIKMLKNPLYFAVSKNPQLIPKTTKDAQKSYFLIPLELPHIDSFIFRGKSWVLAEYHLSIFQEFSDKKDSVSPIHVTSKFYTVTGTIIIHSFFDKFGNYLSSLLNQDDAKKTKIKITTAEELEIKRIIVSNAGPKLAKTFGELFAAQEQAKIKKVVALRKLEAESRNGVRSTTYLSLLREAISACNDYDNLEFHPCYSESKFLQNHREFLEKEPLPGKSKLTPFNPDPVPTRDSGGSHLSELMALITLVEEKFQSTEHLPVDGFAAKTANLYKQLDESPTNDLNNLLEIIKELHEEDIIHQQTLVQACIEGNQKVLAQHFYERDMRLLPALLSTCVYHNQPALFDWLQRRNPFRLFTLSFKTPYVKANPLTIYQGGYKHNSHLEVAYMLNYLPFFQTLLNKYHFNPNELTFTSIPLLLKIIEEKGDMAYIRALVAAGVNPDLTHQGKINFCLQAESKEETAAIQKDMAWMFEMLGTIGVKGKTQSKTRKEGFEDHITAIDCDAFRTGITALHQAVRVNYPEAINLLLEHRANSDLRDRHGYTPFELAMTSGTTISKPVIEAFLKHRHKIDKPNEANQETGLYFHCQQGNLENVKILVGLGASPYAKHKIPTLLGGKQSPLIMTPLAIAAKKGFVPIVRELLKCEIPVHEINRAMLMVPNDSDCRNRSGAYNHEAIQAYKINDFKSAEQLYNFALKYTQSDDEKHSILYNLSSCLFKANKLDEANKTISKCLAIRQTLYTPGHPLLEKACQRSEEISEVLRKTSPGCPVETNHSP
jgi:hypothetical protein